MPKTDLRPALAALLLLTHGAAAETPRAAMFPADTACYERLYDAAHLAEHPMQLVTIIALAPEPAETTAETLALRLSLVLLDSPEIYVATAYCRNSGESLSCTLEADGGLFALDRASDGRLLMTTGIDGIGIEGSGFIQVGGQASDDSSFLLSPGPCG